MFNLNNKVAIVTGAGGGIGEATAVLMAAAGAKVVVTDINFDNVTKVAEKINASGGAALAVAHDVVDKAAWENVLAEANAAFGIVNVLVNNAGISMETPFTQVTDAQWDLVMNVNVKSINHGVRTVLPAMQENGGGSIINISSMAGLIGNCGSGPYTASKGAVTMLTKALAHDFAKDKIRVNSVHPGYIKTPMSAAMFESEQYGAYFANNTPLPYLGEPEDIGNACVFLASDEAKFITGIQMPVDGGIVAG